MIVSAGQIIRSPPARCVGGILRPLALFKLWKKILLPVADSILALALTLVFSARGPSVSLAADYMIVFLQWFFSQSRFAGPSVSNRARTTAWIFKYKPDRLRSPD